MTGVDDVIQNIDDRVKQLVQSSFGHMIIAYTDEQNFLSMMVTNKGDEPLPFHMAKLMLACGDNIDLFFIKFLRYVKDKNIDFEQSIFLRRVVDVIGQEGM